MGKRLLTVLLALSCVFAGCGNGAKLHVYELPAADNEASKIMEYTGDSYEYAETRDYVDSSAVQELSYDFAGAQYALVYQNTSQKEFVPYEEENYASIDGVMVSFKKGTRKVCGIVTKKGLHISYLENPETEEEFQQISDAFIRDYIDTENYSSTLVTEVSYFLQEGEKATRWFEKKDFFYTTSSEIESVHYIFTYRRYLNGLMTSDIAEVVLNSDGTLYSLILTNTGAFEDIGEQMVRQDALNAAVSEKVNAICAEGYQVEDVQSDVLTCIDEKGKLFFLVAAKLTIQAASNDVQIKETCIFIVTEE